jgi:hypothetical protein
LVSATAEQFSNPRKCGAAAVAEAADNRSRSGGDAWAMVCSAV